MALVVDRKSSVITKLCGARPRSRVVRAWVLRKYIMLEVFRVVQEKKRRGCHGHCGHTHRPPNPSPWHASESERSREHHEHGSGLLLGMSCFLLWYDLCSMNGQSSTTDA